MAPGVLIGGLSPSGHFFRPFFNNPMGLYNLSLELGGVLLGMTFESERVVSFTDNRTLTDIIGLINDHLCSIIKAG